MGKFQELYKKYITNDILIVSKHAYISWSCIANETALVLKSDQSTLHKYFILKGDHREAYIPLIEKGLEHCMQYWRDNQDLRSAWSDEE